MTDAQVLAIAVIVVAVMAGSLFNNVRIGDMRDVLRAETKQMHEALLHRIDRMEDNIMRILNDHEQRLTKLEGK